MIIFFQKMSYIRPSGIGKAERLMGKKLWTDTVQIAEWPDTAQSSDYFSMIRKVGGGLESLGYCLSM